MSSLMPRFCPNMRLIMVSEWANSPRYLDMMHVRCKQWSCPYCSPINAQLWKRYLLARLTNSSFGDREWALITLTAHERTHKTGVIETIRNLQSVWRKMYDRLRRYNGASFDYIRIFERHTKGQYKGYHLHVICDIGSLYRRKKDEFRLVLEREQKAKKQGKKPRKRLRREKHPARWIKDACRECKGGFIADFRPLVGDTRNVIRYVTKYATKQLEFEGWPKHVRRVQASRAVGSPKRKNGGNFRRWRPRGGIYREDFDTYDKIIDITMKRIVTLEEDFSNGELWYPPEMID